MRDFAKALSGVEYPASWLEGDGLKDRAVANITSYMLELIARERTDAICEGTDQTYDEYFEMRCRVMDIVRVFWPNIDHDEPNCLVIYPTVDARAKGRSARTHMRIGRALRRMFPVLTDVEVDTLVDRLKDDLFSREWTLKRGREAADFRHAYAHTRAPDQNLATTAAKKALCTSCMRYNFEHLPNHPAEAYASGEFEIIWLEDRQGRIGGRCVVWMHPDHPQPGPIYAVSEEAYDLIYAALPENRGDFYDSDWSGALLKAIPYDGGYVAPYIDTRTKWLTDASPKYLQIDPRGEIDGNNYSGLLGVDDREECSNCNDRIHSDDVYHDCDGNAYCSYCYGEQFIHCEHCHEEGARDTSSEVHINYRGNSYYTETWCEYCVQNDAVECTDDTFWQLDDTYALASGFGFVSIDQINNGDYFICDWNEMAYEMSEHCSLAEGASVSREALDHFNSTDGTYVYVYSDTTFEWHRETVEQEAQASA